ncbi:16S rRNA (guanine(966)-N(2))-methyltransferase RsmD [Vagococcus xieshaowenii]|uniref:16S rRNA (Guanine(966)-N(2))-methyltransferase RsmD n=1 Tax=Vagococcus xieshaowenii TaxID=2562451 RepID=A0AAJ5JMA6_9ENTE|nr:16S rRNA (guanine(966)-N(2))-methyltransferase RsmD [Vagococcus xieshaowenii]QCA28377.1 16S rRNA (guanine(966)-N(2))-methyltransferase RsmD [Vagococcus xieshaowenii]TFZ42866.1 16S rRNA (guanine(966)-N(2))-methyltransferase RsmD [Vagococcus xieshaowenii]
MRIVAGEYGGRRLKTLTGDNTRPTSDKIKGAMFNMLGQYFDGEIVLDLFSGSGNLSLEALSRGCGHAYCIDKNFQAISIIKENVGLVKAESRVTIMKKSAESALQEFAAKKQVFDLVFLDPPYKEQKIVAQVTFMLENGLLSDHARVVCETDKFFDLGEIEGLVCLKNQLYGNTRITIYQKEAVSHD